MATFFWRSLVLVLAAIFAAGALGQAEEVPTQGRRLITDMCGRQVSLPAHVARVVTAEATPSVNSTLMALGKAAAIVNGLPQTMRGPHWKYQYYFAPQLADQPPVSANGTSWVPNLEVLQSLPNDVVFVITPAMAQLLEGRGFTAFCLGWFSPEAMLQSVRLLGEVLECPERSQAWLEYYQEALDRVASRLADLPPDKRCSVLYLRSEGPTSNRTIRDLVTHAGGRYAAPEDLPLPNLLLGAEQLMDWDPEVLLVMGPKQVEQVCSDPRYASLRAVREHRVYAVPNGALSWSHPTLERALGILWMAKHFYPDRFADVDMVAVSQAFYQRFFDRELSLDQIREILHEVPKAP
jgi:iron complex transport system substrate-binding protein